MVNKDLKAAQKITFKKRIARIFKTYLMLGIAVIVPLWLVYWVASFLFVFVRDLTFPIFLKFTPDIAYVQTLTKIGSFFVSIFLVCILGFFTNKVVGKNTLKVVELLISKIPILGTIYSSAKQFTSFIFSDDQTKGFKQVVFVPYPTKDSYCIAFLTSSMVIKGEPYLCAFMPTTPNPSTGFLIFEKKENIIFTQYSIEEAFQFLISVGVISLDKNQIDQDFLRNMEEDVSLMIEQMKDSAHKTQKIKGDKHP
ncbi:MAG: DUF502 domain-containing protein [Elusimicrobiota bacterium]|jgi:uncharacterized membrane protein|nr:DUF502 domain-containing protein [Elusimicrobiota bacterium]